MSDRIVLPEALRAFRMSLGLTQVDLAERLGISRFSINGWESGRTPIPPMLPLALAAVRAGLPPVRLDKPPIPLTPVVEPEEGV